MTQPKYHTSKNGKKILLSELELTHLKNIIALIERKAKEGLEVEYGGGSSAENMFYDKETIFGDEVRSHLNYYDYIEELKRRIDAGIAN